jgi:peptide/nickel transport system permease protein
MTTPEPQSQSAALQAESSAGVSPQPAAVPKPEANRPAQLRRTFLQQLWKRIRRDNICKAALVVLLALYGSVFLADFLAPYSENWNRPQYAQAPPTPIYVIHPQTRQLTWPYVFAYKKDFNPATYEFSFLPVDRTPHPVYAFVQGEPYRFLGLIPTNVHLFGTAPDDSAKVHLLGTDQNGRDIFSRLLFGGQVSLTIGFISILIAFPIALIYGGISGFFGGLADTAMMRLAEVLMSIPTIYLLISLAAILPPDVPSSTRFALVTMLLAFVGWAGLSRVIRGMVLSIKAEDYVEAGRALGMGALPMIIRHILPQTMSYVIVALTVAIPGYILAESSLSYLGLGILQPDASWGNMLKEAQEITSLLQRPWMMAPGYLIFLAVLAFNILGDAVRDVLDPKRTHSRAMRK